MENSTMIILIIVAFAFYLIYSQNQQKNLQLQQVVSKLQRNNSQTCLSCQKNSQNKLSQDMTSFVPNTASQIDNELAYRNPTLTQSVQIDSINDIYSDPIKKQDMYSMYDHLTYPQLRLPRDVLEKYNEYYQRTGSYPPFGQATQPVFDNPILNGILIKQCEENEPFHDNIPSTVPLFRVSSSKNVNRYFYYILDQRYLSKLELKIPLDHIKINNIKYNNADFYGLPEIFDGDIIEHIPIYPSAKFKVMLYKTYHFP